MKGVLHCFLFKLWLLKIALWVGLSSVTSSWGFCIYNEGDLSIKIVLKSGHHGKIDVYLERVHSYLCAGEDPSSIKEVMPMCSSPMFPIAHVSPSPKCPITLVPHQSLVGIGIIH